MYDPVQLQKVLKEELFAECEITFKPMFGGIMAYSFERVFASLSNVGLALKFNGKDHQEFLSVPGSKMLQYEPDSAPSKSYIVVPESMLSNPDILKLWVVRCLSKLPSKKK
ncbi:TfoX/Sxy family protein [Neokomagataea thailandica]|uniref:TfoX N-terminal domain-containing protein n=1 Tax=Neokomagataea tanensis NBRC 106556 TaxID=1223519 RepID=A0ABQ0QFZ7_9PROT|nr:MULTISPECIES: TfoX/Sxy family protein [Neokomagataea]GBR43395.1 hypothetical protein AA106556_0075 [Neokomagataea tanensis NBRC 106556]